MTAHILDFWRLGGPLMPVLALVCFGIWYTLLRLRGRLLAVTAVPTAFADDLLARLSTGSLHDNLQHYSGASDPMSSSVVHVLRSVRAAQAPADAFDDFEQAYLARVETEALVLSALTASAPLLGLLGTVIGMVFTFRAVAGVDGNTAVQVSSGISQALITTQCGLVVAIPGFFGRARIRRLTGHARTRLSACRIHLVCKLEGNPAREEAA